MRADERPLLEPLFEGFERIHGARPTVAPLAKPCAGAPDELFTIAFPPSSSPDNIGRNGHFKHMPGMVAHVRRMGFAWDAQGRVLTAPTPSTFNALRPLLAGPDCGYEASFHREDSPNMSLGPWLDAYLDGRVPLHVASPALYARPFDAAAGFPPEFLSWHAAGFMHDLSVHLLNYHLVPRRCIEDIGRRIRAAMPERAAAWPACGSGAPFTLAWFFDFDINEYAYAVWCRSTGPEKFGPLFAADRHYAQLLAALDQRIEEVTSGACDALVPYDGMRAPPRRQAFRVD